ncbi:unnamed protein product [Alternaria sp. RS040]
MTDSAIELRTLTPAYPHRYPPGIVVIKTLDEQGIEVFEETDLTHRNALFIDLKPTVATKVELTVTFGSLKLMTISTQTDMIG